MPILVLDGFCNAAVETLQSLGRKGLEVDISTESDDCVAFHSRYASEKLRQPPIGSEDFLIWLREQDARRHYDLIVPATEASLLGIRLLAVTDPIRRRAVIPSNESIDIALDKHKTSEFARALGMPVPRYELLSSKRESIHPEKYPVALKSLRSKVIIEGKLQTISTAVIRNAAEYRKVLDHWQPFTSMLWEEYIFGRGIGAEFLYNHGKKIWHFTHERIHELPLTGGASCYRRSIEPPIAMLADAERLLTALEWHGVAMVEFRVDAKGQHWLLEINPRMWGSLALAVDAGVDFPLGLWHLACETEPPPQPQYRTNFYTRDMTMDFKWFVDNLRADPKDKLLLTRSTPLAILQLLRPLIGREAWDHFDRHDLAVTKEILWSMFSHESRRLGGYFKHKPVQRADDPTPLGPTSTKEEPNKPGAFHLH